VQVTTPDGTIADFTIKRTGGKVRVTSDSPTAWSLKNISSGELLAAVNGEAVTQL
jgi:hypothetical protein